MTTAPALSAHVFHAAVTDLVGMPTIGNVPIGLNDGLIAFSPDVDDKRDPDPLVGRDGIGRDSDRLPIFLRRKAMTAGAEKPKTLSGIQQAWKELSDIINSNYWREHYANAVDKSDYRKDMPEDITLRELIRSVEINRRLAGNNPQYFDSIRRIAERFMAWGEDGAGFASAKDCITSALIFASLDTQDDRRSAAEAFLMAAEIYFQGKAHMKAYRVDAAALLYEAAAYNFERSDTPSVDINVAAVREMAAEAWMESLRKDKRRETRIFRIYRAMSNAWPNSWKNLAALYGMYSGHIARDREYLEAARSKIRFVWKRVDDLIYGKTKEDEADEEFRKRMGKGLEAAIALSEKVGTDDAKTELLKDIRSGLDKAEEKEVETEEVFWRRMGDSLKGAIVFYKKAGEPNGRPELLEDLTAMAEGLMKQARAKGKAKTKKKAKAKAKAKAKEGS